MDTRLLLATILIIILILGYQFTGKKLSSPVVLFLVPFIIQAIDAGLYYPWNISYNTLLLVSSFSAIFVLTCSIVNYLFSRKKASVLTIGNNTYFTSKQYLLMIMLLLVVILYLYRTVRTLSGVADGSFAEIVGTYNDATKAGETDSLPTLPSLFYNGLCGAAFAFAFLFAHSITSRKRQNLWLSFILFAVASAGILVSGSRTGAVGPIIGAIILMLMMNESQHQIDFLQIKVKYIVYLFVFLLLFLGFFYLSIDLLGRKVDQSRFDYLSVYIGAPLQNFDSAVRQGISSSEYFGQNTFRGLYPTLEKFSLVPEGTSIIRLPFESRDGYFLGNVYTIYYALIADFGILGTYIAVIFMAVIAQIVFNLAMRHMQDLKMPFSPVLYALICFSLFMSFFSTNFYQNTFSLGFVKNLLGIAIIVVFQRLCSSHNNRTIQYNLKGTLDK